MESLGLLMGVLVIVGAVKMKNLKSYGLAMTAAIIAIIPCSPCCLLGLPFGIWALVVLNDENVKAAFYRPAPMNRWAPRPIRRDKPGCSLPAKPQAYTTVSFHFPIPNP